MLHLQLSHTLSLATQTFGKKVLEKKLRESTCGLFRGRGGSGGEGVEEREGKREGGGGSEGEREEGGGREGEGGEGEGGRGREEREKEGGEGGGEGEEGGGKEGRVYQVTFANLS